MVESVESGNKVKDNLQTSRRLLSERELIVFQRVPVAVEWPELTGKANSTRVW
jgi:hypothetical protein